ncbi:MAG: hypothetical protein EON54_06685 [Alcaligenaceae bacterium]|nr:MAG: hypothetical protein EON54_06685 [Alcaligenaceae bacterium]
MRRLSLSRLFRAAVSLLLVCSFAAHAADPVCKTWRATIGSEIGAGVSSGPHPTQAAALADALAQLAAKDWKVTCTWTNGTTATIDYAYGFASADSGANWQFNQTGCGANAPEPANTFKYAVGYVSEDGPCNVDQCKPKQGQDTTVNWTVGYSRYPIDHPSAYTLISPTVDPPADGVMCVDSCKVAATYYGAGVTGMYSASPTAQGTYRLSMDYPALHLGQSCTSAEAQKPLSPTEPIPPCVGAVGTVNNVKVCTGTAANPVRNDTPTAKPPNAQEGNPRAGEKPSSGQGSGSGGAGRTPSTGNGGPGGGPAAAAGTGKGPDGTTPKPVEGKEQAACGAPGQPKCRIDETGTPDGKGVFDDAKKQFDDADKQRNDELEKIKGTSDKDTSWGQSFGWVQHGGCVPWNLGTLPLGAGIPIEVDICPIMPYIEWVTSFLWGLATFALTIGMVFRVTTSSGS